MAGLLGGPRWRRGDIVQLTKPDREWLRGVFLVITHSGDCGGGGYVMGAPAVDLPKFTTARYEETTLVGRASIMPDGSPVDLDMRDKLARRGP